MANRVDAPPSVSRASAPIWRMGGKGALAGDITALFPPHDSFLDLFGGAGHIIFAKTRAKLDIYNDLDAGLSNFFRVLRDPEQSARLKALLDLTPYDRNEWRDCRTTWRAMSDPVEKARRWFVVSMQGFAGPTGKAWGFVTDPKASVAQKYRNAIDRIGFFTERMQGMQVDGLDWRKALKYYAEKPGVGTSYSMLVYADPPYMSDTRRDGSYEHELTEADHRDLLDQLQHLPIMAMISGYDTPLYQTTLVEQWGWQRFAWTVTASMVARTGASGYKGKNKIRAGTDKLNLTNADPASQQGKQTRMECLWVKPNTIMQRELWG